MMIMRLKHKLETLTFVFITTVAMYELINDLRSTKFYNVTYMVHIHINSAA